MQKATPIWAVILAWAVLSGPGRAAAFTEISAALAAGNGPEAVRLADAGLAEAGISDADRTRLIADRGFAHNLEGDKDDALTDFTQAINAKVLTAPEQARLYLERGLIMDAMNRFDDAIGDYGAALSLNPVFAPALNNRANIFRRQNHFDDARRDYLASLAADNPAPEYPLYGLGQIAESEGWPQEAKSFYVRALAANPGYSLAAGRLQALGGTPAPEQPIVLRPPPNVSAGPLLLHPPAARKPAPAQASPPQKLAAVSGRHEQPALGPTVDKAVGEQVQMGAWRSEAEAAEGWGQAVAQANGALAGFSPHIVTVDLPGKGRYYRLRVITPNAKQLCATLNTLKVPCISVLP